MEARCAQKLQLINATLQQTIDDQDEINDEQETSNSQQAAEISALQIRVSQLESRFPRKYDVTG